MTTDSDYLVVYGTLRPSFGNSSAHYLRAHSQYVGEGSFLGQLYDLGHYPGAVYQHDGHQIVLCTIYDISQHKQILLPYLDDYEGVGDQFTKPTEYIRAQIPVTYNNTIIYCWAYLYNLPVGDKPIISSGNYTEYVNQ